MAGDCAMEVMAVGAVDEDPIRRFDDENLCMQFLQAPKSDGKLVIDMSDYFLLGSDVP